MGQVLLTTVLCQLAQFLTHARHLISAVLLRGRKGCNIIPPFSLKFYFMKLIWQYTHFGQTQNQGKGIKAITEPTFIIKEKNVKMPQKI